MDMKADLRLFAQLAKVVDYTTGPKDADIGALLDAIDKRTAAVAKLAFGEMYTVEVYDHREVSDSIAIDVITPKMDKDKDKGFYWIEAWSFTKDIAKFQAKTGTVFSDLEIRALNRLAIGFHIPYKKASKLYAPMLAS